MIEERISYRNSAVIGIIADIEQFGTRIPQRSYDLKGLIISVPNNYDPDTRGYTGTWDGTFTTAWTDNPAWVFYDLLSSNRYGLGEYLPSTFLSQIRWQLYTIAQYCDQLVPDGQGGMEPRFTFNGVINSSQKCPGGAAGHSIQFPHHSLLVIGRHSRVSGLPKGPHARGNQGQRR